MDVSATRCKTQQPQAGQRRQASPVELDQLLVHQGVVLDLTLKQRLLLRQTQAGGKASVGQP